MIRCLLLLLSLAPPVRTALSADAPRHPLLPPPIATQRYTRRERAEHARAWRVLGRSCAGCWSGSLSAYRVAAGAADAAGGDPPLVLTQPPALNFRLRVRRGARTGTWTVWNLQRAGDEAVVPLRRIPHERPTQIKIGFAAGGRRRWSGSGGAGIILRVPCAVTAAIPRFVFEIGYWNRTTRRTAVVEYKPSGPSRLWSGNADGEVDAAIPEHVWKLDEITLVQMKKQRGAFVGNTTDPRAIAYLPTRFPTWRPSDDYWWEEAAWWTAASETVDLTTMERRWRRRFDEAASSALHQRVASAFMDASPAATFTAALPNELCLSLPRAWNSKKRKDDGEEGITRAIFWHAWDERTMDVIEVEYQRQRAKRVSLHSFRRCK